jgi:CheY-like chemotaxis protein
MTAPQTPRQVLLVENDEDVLAALTRSLEDSDLRVLAASTIVEALDRVETTPDLAAVVLDLRLTPGKGGEAALRGYEDLHPNGYALAARIRKGHPNLPILGMTGQPKRVTPECVEWFRDRGDPPHSGGVYDKVRQWELLRHRICKIAGTAARVRIFLVHGHDHAMRDQFCDYARSLGFEPRTLGGLEWGNSTWIELFEQEAERATLAWILLTGDDFSEPLRQPGTSEVQPRPNVLLELGYFLGRYGRNSRRVYLFHCGDLKLASDLDGVACVRVETDVQAADAEIRRQIAPWLG